MISMVMVVNGHMIQMFTLQA